MKNILYLKRNDDEDTKTTSRLGEITQCPFTQGLQSKIYKLKEKKISNSINKWREDEHKLPQIINKNDHKPDKKISHVINHKGYVNQATVRNHLIPQRSHNSKTKPISACV